MDPNSSLGQLVVEQPARAEVFERLRLDYCCGGAQTLAQACERRGLDVETVRWMLDALEDPLLGPRHTECNDWRRASLAELCDHIVSAHHDRLRVELQRIDKLMSTVVRVHGGQHPELHDLHRLFATLRHELEAHIAVEEVVVFPACRAAEAGGAPVDDQVLIAHEQEHANAGDALAALRELADDYNTSGALCRTHRNLLDALQQFELDLHQHIHEENNVLFPRARALS